MKDEGQEKFARQAATYQNYDKNLPVAKSARHKVATVSAVVCVFVSLLVGAVGFAFGTRYQYIFAGGQLGGLDYSELNEIFARLNAKYDGELDAEKLLEGAATGFAAAAGDPYTSFLTEKDALTLTGDLSGEFQGIGAELGQNKENQLEIISVLDDSPAKIAGLKSKDLISEVNGENSLNWTAAVAAEKIRGEAGTTVKLKIIRDGEAKEFAIKRARVQNPSVKTEIKDDGIGYMRISQFGEDTAQLSKIGAQKFKSARVKGVVLDLRANGGGYVDAARAVASLWLERDKVVVQEKRGAKVVDTMRASGDNILGEIPTIVMIDGGSASSSEIVAGALRDNGVAKLIGEQSYGKGSVQELIPLSTGNSLKITVAKWYTPNGANIDGDGLKPDETVKLDEKKYADGVDTQLEYAKKLLK